MFIIAVSAVIIKGDLYGSPFFPPLRFMAQIEYLIYKTLYMWFTDIFNLIFKNERKAEIDRF